MRTAAIIVAAGRGVRAGGPLPKQWQTIAGRSVAGWTLRAFENAPDIDEIVLVVHEDDMTRARSLPEAEGVMLVVGGADRAASVRAGLEALAPTPPDRVLIHDVARPCVRQTLIAEVCRALKSAPGAAPALAVSDALWTGTEGFVTGAQSRDGLFRAQTPQGFHYVAIRDAHAARKTPAADDVEIARAAGLQVAILPGSDDNLKITTPGDFVRAEKLLAGQMDIRLGNGFDVHRFGAGDHVTLCGVQVPHDRGLLGHSDADVGMHAVTDAIYGALAMGDIGRHFPPSDEQWKGADSAIFLRHAVHLAGEHGFAIANVDCTLICERPKIGPHAPTMQTAMADLLRIEASRVSVKATTSEQLGFTGREEGIAALATATLVKT